MMPPRQAAGLKRCATVGSTVRTPAPRTDPEKERRSQMVAQTVDSLKARILVVRALVRKKEVN